MTSYNAIHIIVRLRDNHMVIFCCVQVSNQHAETKTNERGLHYPGSSPSKLMGT